MLFFLRFTPLPFVAQCTPRTLHTSFPFQLFSDFPFFPCLNSPSFSFAPRLDVVRTWPCPFSRQLSSSHSGFFYLLLLLSRQQKPFFFSITQEFLSPAHARHNAPLLAFYMEKQSPMGSSLLLRQTSDLLRSPALLTFFFFLINTLPKGLRHLPLDLFRVCDRVVTSLVRIATTRSFLNAPTNFALLRIWRPNSVR